MAADCSTDLVVLIADQSFVGEDKPPSFPITSSCRSLVHIATEGVTCVERLKNFIEYEMADTSDSDRYQ